MDVKLQSIRGELILADFGNIEMSGTKSFSVELTEKQLDLETPGFHQVPFRILYRDGNRVPFSSTFLQSYTLKPGTLPEPEPPVLITFGKPINGNGAIDVVDTAALEMTLNNSSKNEVDVRLEMIEPREMKFSLSQSAMKLGPGETKNVEIKIQNAGALTGSAYVIFALVSGVSQGRAFANYGSFVTNIVVKADLPWIPILIGVLIALFVAVDLFRRFRKSSAKS
ncbi:MAG: hypothetical protein COT73_04985 [Bdellovibrio sp. CG10_big_fil_rev_8_21_14_0_10_47_8]|nr:MAG: hypothetical protein COT73_04985 [Bdellovibrio sp. CG10_big_fil_rev_8_21_14_0_10_47_8]